MKKIIIYLDIYTSDNHNKNKYKAHEYLKENMHTISFILQKLLKNLPIRRFKTNNMNCNFEIYSNDSEILKHINNRLIEINKKGYVFHAPFYLYFRPQESLANYERKMFVTDDSNNLNF